MASIDPIGDICDQYEILFEQICNGSKQANDNLFIVLNDGCNEVKLAIKNIDSNNQHLFDNSLIDKVKAI